MSDLETFTNAYIEALIFTEELNADVDDDIELDADARLDIEADCRSFWRRFGPFITTDVCRDAFDDSVAQAGYDFHMTRNGHGVGFWEDEWPEVYRDMLDNGAKSYGPLESYIGDDGLLYV